MGEGEGEINSTVNKLKQTNHGKATGNDVTRGTHDLLPTRWMNPRRIKYRWINGLIHCGLTHTGSNFDKFTFNGFKISASQRYAYIKAILGGWAPRVNVECMLICLNQFFHFTAGNWFLPDCIQGTIVVTRSPAIRSRSWSVTLTSDSKYQFDESWQAIITGCWRYHGYIDKLERWSMQISESKWSA